MKGIDEHTGQEWMTKDECELFEYLGNNINKVCQPFPHGYCNYRKHLRDGKWGLCEKHGVLIKLGEASS